MSRKRAPGGGRKPADKAGPKTETILTRVSPDLRRKIEIAKKIARSRSLSAEIVRLLELGLKVREDAGRSDAVRDICHLIALTAKACAAGTPFDLTDPFMFRAFKLAVAQLLDSAQPPGDCQSVVDRLGEADFLGAPPSIVDSYRTPEARAKAAAELVWTVAQKGIDDDTLAAARALGDRGAIVERMHYRMANARKSLNINS